VDAAAKILGAINRAGFMVRINSSGTQLVLEAFCTGAAWAGGHAGTGAGTGARGEVVQRVTFPLDAPLAAAAAELARVLDLVSDRDGAA
jgi:hypothetical protein